MSERRFKHKKITHQEFNAELDRQGMKIETFTRLWCQNLTTVERWSNGQLDIPTWVPIAMSLMTLPDGIRTARIAAAAMIEQDTLRPELGPFPYRNARELADEELA